MTSKILSCDTETAHRLPNTTLNEDEIEWDEVAESSWESFPASDPPAWAGQGSPRLSRTSLSKI